MNQAPEPSHNPVPCPSVARKITVPLGDDLDRLLREAARKDGSSEAAFVREAIIARAAQTQVRELEERIARIEQHLGLGDS